MSIFDTNKLHPVEYLYNECRDICEYIIPMNMIHYNREPTAMRTSIIRMLKEHGLYQQDYPYIEGGINKICEVCCAYKGYVHNMPMYDVWFFYNSSVDSDQFSTRYRRSYLTSFEVGIKGIINKNITEDINNKTY